MLCIHQMKASNKLLDKSQFNQLNHDTQQIITNTMFSKKIQKKVWDTLQEKIEPCTLGMTGTPGTTRQIAYFINMRKQAKKAALRQTKNNITNCRSLAEYTISLRKKPHNPYTTRKNYLYKQNSSIYKQKETIDRLIQNIMTKHFIDTAYNHPELINHQDKERQAQRIAQIGRQNFRGLRKIIENDIQKKLRTIVLNQKTIKELKL